jgi:peptidoglycan/xylan/chitin deacetylase (PgdA/CDA1 family)
MSALQSLWLAVTIATVIFLVVAAISAMPKMKILRTAIIAVIFVASSGITAFGSFGTLVPAAALAMPAAAVADGSLPPPPVPGAPLDKLDGPVPFSLPPAPDPGAPLDNDASAGKVVFTFDDGPDVHTLAVVAELNELHLHGVFFMIGDKIAAHLPAVSAEIANGEVIGDHTWNHRSFTGKGTGTTPLTQAQVRAELAQTAAAIVAAGAPQPTLWRPPYGAVDGNDVATARTLGLRIVLDSGPNIIESDDWAGLKPAQIAARVDPALRDGTIIAFHDGLTITPNTIAALPLIVAFMNRHHLGATTTVRPDATGGCCKYWNTDNQSTTTNTGGDL